MKTTKKYTSKCKKYKRISILLSTKQIKRILKGYTVQKKILNREVGDIRLSIMNGSKDRKIERKILRLKQKIVKLQNERTFRIKHKEESK